MQPLLVLCAVGLTPDLIGADTPHLAALAGRGFCAPMTTVLPALTTSAQTSMLTGVLPQEHGIVANGWYFRELGEIWLWRQSQGLVQAPLVWQGEHPLRTLKHFWWYAMNTDVAATVTPRPVYRHDGRKEADCYAWPPELKTALAATHGTFPLFRFWGPATSIESTDWIADSFSTAIAFAQPQLALCYLPHLDYDFQRHGPQGAHVARNLRALDAAVGRILARHPESPVLVVSEYGIEAVDHGVYLNRLLRERGWLSVSDNSAGELLDPGPSRAFAVCDHQIAHVYLREASDCADVLAAVKSLPGVAEVYCGGERAQVGLNHPRSGEIVAFAEPGCWFCHDYWLDQRRKPDFANAVEIHKKPGYDPRELHFDPQGGKRRAATALLRKKLGLRYSMNAIASDDRLVKGSHGRPACAPGKGAVILGSNSAWAKDRWHQCEVAGLIRQILGSGH
jgi:predicted AlkP superfamily pyrophosphatase or phosphodiesterase